MSVSICEGDAKMKLKSSLALLVHRVSLLLAFGLFALLILLGTQARHTAAQSPSFVRVIHASPFVGTADVFVDGAKLLSSFGFGSVTDYAAIPAGPHKVQIALVGKGINAAALTQTLAVQPGFAYTVAAIGTQPTNLSLEVFVDNNLITPGMAKVRVYHLSPNAGPVNVAAGSTTILQGITYQKASGYLALPVGSYTFNVDATNLNTTLPISVTLKANTVTSIFTVGMFNGTPKLALVSAQVSGLPGLPGTGSDPNPISSDSPFLSPWFLLLAALEVVLIGTSVITRRMADGR